MSTKEGERVWILIAPGQKIKIDQHELQSHLEDLEVRGTQLHKAKVLLTLIRNEYCSERNHSNYFSPKSIVGN